MPKILIKTFKIPCQKTTINKYDIILVKTLANEYCYVYANSKWNMAIGGGDLTAPTEVEIQDGYLNFQMSYTNPTNMPTKAAYLPCNWI